MKKYIIGIYLLCIASLAFSQPTINPGYTAVLTTEFSSSNFYFVNTLTGYLVDNRPYTPANYNYSKTTNGGSTWTTTLISGSKSQICFLNQFTGFSTGTLSKSTNSGDNWTSLGVTSASKQITFINDTVGFFLNSGGLISGNSTNQIYKTTDSGNNWTVILQGYHPSTMEFRYLEFVNANTGYAIGDAYHYYLDPKSNYVWAFDSVEVLKTTNGGTNWVKKFIPQPYINYLISSVGPIKFFNENTGYLQTRTSGHNYILKTTNGGTNWNLVKEMPTYIGNWQFLDTNKVWAYNNFYIIKSTDAFANFTKESIYDTTDNYSQGKMFDNGTGYIYSNKWKKLYKTTPLTNIPIQTSTEVPDKFSLAQNYPNPFNPTTKINYDIPIDENVTIKIFDSNGKEISTIVHEFKKSGYYSIDFNAASLPSGIFFYKLIAGSFSETKKMILLK